MVIEQLLPRGINDPGVLEAMQQIPRHRFISPEQQALAYQDGPLPIGCDQTISQPYIVALMTQALQVSPGQSVLEIGTGSGYQTAVLCALGARVVSLERILALQERAAAVLEALSYYPEALVWADGSEGCKKYAPYDAVLFTCACQVFPARVWEQLKPGGRIVLPLGPAGAQELLYYQKNGEDPQPVHLAAVRFVPLLDGVEKKHP